MKRPFITVILFVLALFIIGCGEVAEEELNEVKEPAVAETPGKTTSLDCTGLPFGDELCAVLETGGTAHCTFTRDGKPSETWFQVTDASKPSFNYRSKSHFYVGDKSSWSVMLVSNYQLKSYTWFEGVPTGFKMEMDLSKIIDKYANTVPEEYDSNKDLEKYSTDIKCERANVDIGFFNPPSDIEFTSLGDMPK